MPSAGATRSSLLQATVAEKGRFNSSSQRSVGKETACVPACTLRRKPTLVLQRELQQWAAAKPPLSVKAQGQGRLVGSGTPPIFSCRLKVSPCRAGGFPPPAEACLTVSRQKDRSHQLPQLTSSLGCFLGSPKYTGLWDSYLVLT